MHPFYGDQLPRPGPDAACGGASAALLFDQNPGDEGGGAPFAAERMKEPLAHALLVDPLPEDNKYNRRKITIRWITY